jgi:hypothetical protein
LGIWGDGGVDHSTDLMEFLVVSGVIAGAALVVFGWVVPRGLRGEGARVRRSRCPRSEPSWSFPAFWSGVPLVLGASGMLVGWASHDASRGRGQARAGVVLGALTVLAVIAIYCLDWMSTNGVI